MVIVITEFLLQHGGFAISIILPFLTLAVIIKCYSSMKNQRRSQRALITLLNVTENEQIPVLFL